MGSAGRGDGLASGEGVVQDGQLMHEHAERPAIADDMVQRHQQEILLLAQPQQAAPQQRALCQVEGALAFFLHQALGFILSLSLGQLPAGHAPSGAYARWGQ